MADKPTLHVLDGTAALFRAYFGMDKLAAPDGLEVGGLLGLAQWVARYLRQVRPRHVAVVMDAPEKTFRHAFFPQYKANRKAPPADLEPQFSLALEVTAALGVPSFQVPGYEADDIMATLAARGRRAGIACVLVTPDKDVCQLVGADVWMSDPRSFSLMGPEQVKKRMGVLPERICDLLALAGDSSDNVPGVRGIGQKTATALIQEFASLEELFENLERVAQLPLRGAAGVARKLASGRAAAELSLRLVRLHQDVPLPSGLTTLKDLRWRGPSGDAETLFDRLGFHQPLRTLSALSRP